MIGSSASLENAFTNRYATLLGQNRHRGVSADGVVSPDGLGRREQARVRDLQLGTLVGETLVNGGYIIEITREALRRVGYTLEVKFVPWKRAIEIAKDGDVDGVIGTNYSDERAQTYRLTDVVYQEENGFFGKKGGRLPIPRSTI